MSLPIYKVITTQSLIEEAGLSGKEIDLYFEHLSLNNHNPDTPFVFQLEITSVNKNEYDIFWHKIEDMLVKNYGCVLGEKILIVSAY